MGDHKGCVFSGIGMVTGNVGGGGSPGGLGRWGVRHILKDAPASGGNSVGVRGWQRDLCGGRDRSGGEGNKMGSLSGSCVYFRRGEEECRRSRCVIVVVLRML